MRKEKVAVIGGGGREDAQITGLLKSTHVESGIAIPGNDFMKVGQTKPVTIFPGVSVTDANQIIKICKGNGVTYAEVGNERAVEAGVVDRLTAAGISTLGPTAAAGILEYDKGFSRHFGRRHFLPQPIHKWFASEESGIAFIEESPEEKRFIKYCGLCDGKGAIPAETRTEAIAAIKEMKTFNNGLRPSYLIEDWLRNDDGTTGEEFSSFCITDGVTWKYLGDAQDHKRVNEGDTGKNTGGMGCSNKPGIITPEARLQIDSIFKRTIFGMALEKRKYKGILYLGGMVVTRNGKPEVNVIEFNCRPGDPEHQIIASSMTADLFQMGRMALSDDLSEIKVEADGKSRVVVAGVSKGYPDSYDAVKGKRIFGLDEAMAMDGIDVYGAGISVIDGNYYANGGRLFYVVGEGKDIMKARVAAYSALSRISVEGGNLHFRTDIGWRDVKRHLLRKDTKA